MFIEWNIVNELLNKDIEKSGTEYHSLRDTQGKVLIVTKYTSEEYSRLPVAEVTPNPLKQLASNTHPCQLFEYYVC